MAHRCKYLSSWTISLGFMTSVLVAWADAGQQHDRPYATGVYWKDHGVYVLDVTVHNDPPLDDFPIVELTIEARGSFGFESPEGWSSYMPGRLIVHWRPDNYENAIPPGEALSGFVFRNSTLQDQYSYGLACGYHKFGNVFTPVLIPEPGLAAVLGWGACGAGFWALKRWSKCTL